LQPLTGRAKNALFSNPQCDAFFAPTVQSTKPVIFLGITGYPSGGHRQSRSVIKLGCGVGWILSMHEITLIVPGRLSRLNKNPWASATIPPWGTRSPDPLGSGRQLPLQQT